MYELRLPRHACSPRDRARAGDLWRLVQEAAVLHSTEQGWPPSRYRATGTGFVVRQMTGVHRREAAWGEVLRARTWVAESRRDILMRRESEIAGVLRTTAEWVHVDGTGGPARAPRELADAFPVTPEDGPRVEVPPRPAGERFTLPTFSVTPFWTEMDPMGHVNHPRYLDWVDEAISVWLAARGADPIGLVPRVDQIRFRHPATAGDALAVEVSRVGPPADAAVFEFRIRRDDTTLVEGVVHRAHLDGPGVFAT